MDYIEISDKYIDDLFRGTNFGEPANSSTDEKRQLIKESLRNQLGGYWSGRTIYQIMVRGGFLIDAKFGSEKKLTALGKAFLNS